jgi:hypothetical protein
MSTTALNAPERAAVAAHPSALETARLAAAAGRLPRAPEPPAASPPAAPRPELWQRVPRRFFHLRAALGDRAAQRRVDREQRREAREARLHRLLGTVPGGETGRRPENMKHPTGPMPLGHGGKQPEAQGE